MGLQLPQSSTLLLECFSLGYRTAFFTFADRKFNSSHPDYLQFYPWCWPGKLNDEGFFWSNLREEKIILNVMNNLLNVSQNDWEKITLEHKKNVMHRDQGNKIIKKILMKEGIKIS